MTIFYRGPGIRITHEVFEIRGPIQRSYAIRDLAHPYVLERAGDPPPLVGSLRTGSTGVAGATAVAAALGWAADWQVLASPLTTLALLALLLISIVVSGACWRVHTVEQELVAVHHGQPVSLLRTTDARTFGQVRRALLRALELSGDTT
jgi:hypothetical protein